MNEKQIEKQIVISERELHALINAPKQARQDTILRALADVGLAPTVGHVHRMGELLEQERRRYQEATENFGEDFARKFYGPKLADTLAK